MKNEASLAGILICIFMVAFNVWVFFPRRRPKRARFPAIEAPQTEEARQRVEPENQEKQRLLALESKALQIKDAEIERLSRIRLANWDVLMTASPYEFEAIVASLFEKNGYRVRQTRPLEMGGKDLVVERHFKTSYVECKRYDREHLITTPTLRSFLGAMASGGVQSGIFVTTSDFNENALAFAKKHRIVTINGERLVAGISKLVKGNRRSDSFKALCTVCGNIGDFPLQKEKKPFNCQCGATIRHAIVDSDLTLSSLAYRATEERCPQCDGKLVVGFGYRGKPLMKCTASPSCGFTKGFQ